MKAGTAEAKRRGRKAAETRRMRKRVQSANAYNIDAAAGHAFGPNPVSVRRTAEKKARRELEYEIYGRPGDKKSKAAQKAREARRNDPNSGTSTFDRDLEAAFGRKFR